jgi:precorrin-6B methylase 2
METLEQIIIKYNLHKTDHMEGTDKYSIHQYIQRFYENIFLNYFNKEIRLLEIGTATGASLLLWRNYFKKGDIYGIDEVNANYFKEKYFHNNINYLRFDAYDEKNAENLNNFDIIIDDGAHEDETNIKAINIYFEKLNNSGLFVIEDIAKDIYLDNAINALKSKNPKEIGIIDNRQFSNDGNSRLIWAIK